MTPARSRLLARVLFAFIILGLVLATLLSFTADVSFSGQDAGSASLVEALIWVAMVLTFAVSGLVIASRQPGNVIGWFMLAVGVIAGTPLFALGQYGIANPGTVPFAEVALAFDAANGMLGIALVGPMMVYLFPDGRPASPRWRPVVWASAVGLILLWLAVLLSPDLFEDSPLADLENPLAIDALEPLEGVLLFLRLALPISFVLACVSMIQRYRRSRGVERQQLKWFTAATATAATIFAVAMTFWLLEATTGFEPPLVIRVVQSSIIAGFLLIPLSVGIAVARFHLYDIDLVINKALVLGIILGFITLVYLGVVVGIGSVVGQGGSSDMVLTVAATAVVAIAFQPIRTRAHRLADRLVYGKRASAEELLAAYTPQGVADRLVSGEVGADRHEELEATVLFSDLRGFSTLAEHLSPRALVDLVGMHLSAMAEVVDAHGGMVDKFQGDAVMAVFGVTEPRADHAARALRCALAMQERQAELNHELDSREDPLLHMGIGVNTGEVVAGTIGGGGRLEFTVVGDVVNVAQRLQGEAEGGQILATAACVAQAGPAVSTEAVGLLSVKGREQPVDAHAVKELVPEGVPA